MTNKNLKIGALLSYFAIAINIAAGLLYTPWMVDQIGKSDYGLYTLSHSLISLFAVDFGLASAVERYISKYRAENKKEEVNTFLGAIYKLYFLIDFLLFLVLAIVYFNLERIYVNLSPIEIERFKVVFLISAAYTLFSFPFTPLAGILKSHEKFIQVKLADLLYRCFTVGFTIFALVMGYGLFALVWVNVFVGVAVTLLKYAMIRIQTPAKANFKHTSTALYAEIFRFSGWVMVAMLAQRLIFNITPSILGIVADSDQIAYFGVVSTVEAYVYTIATAINGMFMPKIARIYAQEDNGEKMMSLLLRVGRFQCAINGLIVVGFAVLGRQFVSLWMGETYLVAYYGILLVILPGLFFNPLQIANTAMIVKGKVNIQAYIGIAVGLLNVFLSFLLSSRYGAVGACISICIAYLLRATLYHIVHDKVMGFDMKRFAKQCYVKLLLPATITLSAGFLMNRFANLPGWGGFVCKGVVVVAVFLLSLFVFGVTASEKQELKKLLAPKRSK